MIKLKLKPQTNHMAFLAITIISINLEVGNIKPEKEASKAGKKKHAC